MAYLHCVYTKTSITSFRENTFLKAVQWRRAWDTVRIWHPFISISLITQVGRFLLCQIPHLYLPLLTPHPHRSPNRNPLPPLPLLVLPTYVTLLPSLLNLTSFSSLLNRLSLLASILLQPHNLFPQNIVHQERRQQCWGGSAPVAQTWPWMTS